MSHGSKADGLLELHSDNDTEIEDLILSSGSEESPELARRGGKWTALLILAAVTSTLGSCVPAGYSIGVVNAPAQIIKEFCNQTIRDRYDVVLTPFLLNTLWSSIVSIFVIGGVIGSFTGSASADRWGRKGSIIITDALGAAGALCFILSKELLSVEALLIGRFIIGLSSGLATAIVPMYLTELAPLKLRGATGVMCPLGLTTGVLLSQIMGLESIMGKKNTWQYLLALYAVFSLPTLLLMLYLPESPKYLAAIRYQEERAITELLRLRGQDKQWVNNEVHQLRNEISAERQRTNWTSRKLLKDAELRLPLLLVCALQAGQQFSGINAVFYYSITIFESAGLTGIQSKYANIGAGCVNLIAGIMAIFTMNRFGRRILLQISCIGSMISLSFLVVSIALSTLASWIAYISVAAVLLYVLIYGLGLGPIPYFIGTELFEVGPRPIAMAWGSMSNWGGNFVVGMFFPFLQSAIGEFSFLIFIATTMILTIFIFIYLPETKDKHQTEISELLKHGFRSCTKRNTQQRGKVETNANPSDQTEFESF